MPDPSNLTDDDLKAMLLQYGVKAGPIVGSTRALYERKLKKLLQSDGHDRLNGAVKAVLYSDSEEEAEDEESGSEKQERAEQAAQQESSQRACPSNRKPTSEWNSRNVSKASERSWSHRTQDPVLISRASSVHQHSGIGSGMESRRSRSTNTNAESELNGSNVQEHWSRSSRLPQEAVKDVFKDLIPDIKTTPTGIYATCRRPIKGAAPRPIQYAYPDTPISPMTLERREVERRLVPIQIQIFIFLIVACIIYLLFVNVEDGSFVLSLLDSLNQGSDSQEGFLLQAETQAVSE